MNGILLLDKPAGMTSHDVVSRVRKALGTREVGHGGTLDPNATGLLVVAVGNATRWLPYLPGDKRYAAALKLGVATSTEDIWGEVTERDERPAPPESELKAALESLVELREQVPPMVSALKQDGRRLYELAREGQVVERAARPVEIKAVHVDALRGLEADFTVDCGAGTYVRTLCVEAGKRLGRPACLSALRRLRHGGLSVERALPEAQWTREGLEAALLGADQALAHLPAHACSDAEATDLGHGRALKLSQQPQAGAWRLNYQGRLLALAEASEEAPWRLQPRRVFND
jgi:tRNA pseudouridine55 synthase